MNTTPQKKSFSQWLTTSITVRMLTVGILILILLIPLSYIQNLIEERASRRAEVVTEINQKWGNEVLIYGPILKIPYQIHNIKQKWNEKTKSYDDEDRITTQVLYFFPEHLDIQTHVASETLGRSIYESVVYTADIHIKGDLHLQILKPMISNPKMCYGTKPPYW